MESIIKRRKYDAAYKRGLRAARRQLKETRIMLDTSSSSSGDPRSEEEMHDYSSSFSSNAFADLDAIHDTSPSQEDPSLHENVAQSPIPDHVDSEHDSVNYPYNIDSDHDSLNNPYREHSSTTSEDDDLSSSSIADDIRHLRQMDVKGTALDFVIAMFRKRGYSDLPVSHRTILNTPEHVEIQHVADMEYYYFGVESQIRIALEHASSTPLSNETIILSLGIDGLSLFKSKNLQCWPVLGSIESFKTTYSIFPIAIAICEGKPSSLKFLEETIAALNSLMTNGFVFQGKIYSVSVKCCVCDTPGRNLVKKTKAFNGFWGCDYCVQRGDYRGRVVFMEFQNLNLRSDSNFRSRVTVEGDEHHKPDGESPFLQLLNFDMVQQFPLDYMHCVCLGVTKKLLTMWVFNRNTKQKYKLPDSVINALSKTLLKFRDQFPSNFARRPRKLQELDRWKATEFRQFLLYTGPLVLKDFISTDQYLHFLSLSVAISILCNPHLVLTHGLFAHGLLKFFNDMGAYLYGPEFMVYNVHSLVHLYDAAHRFGSLEACSAWKYENYLHMLRKKVRIGRSPLVQIVKRLSECHIQTPVHSDQELSVKASNNVFYTNDGKFVSLLHKRSDGCYQALQYCNTEPLFHNPCCSLDIGIAVGNPNNTINRVITENEVKGKCLKLNIKDNKIYLSLLNHCL